MSLFVDQRQFKEDMNLMIDRVVPNAEAYAEIPGKVAALIEEHGIQVNVEMVGKQIFRLVATENRARAKKLVAAFDDRQIKLGALAVIKLVVWGTMGMVPLGFLAAFVITVIMMWEWVQS